MTASAEAPVLHAPIVVHTHMGPSRARDEKPQDDAKALLREKDNRIADLEGRLEAYSARASTAQTRLLKTIDVLDALRSQHALEISTGEQAKMKLVHELDRMRSVVTQLEVEKDELKDVVEDLIEKAGCTSRNMQRGNLNVGFPEQVSTVAVDNGGTTEDEDFRHDLLAYATSIIARLRTELDFERQSHNKAVEEANLRIEELEAQVAVREAELERCVTSLGDRDRQSLDVSSAKQKPGGKLPEPNQLSDAECLRFLESNNARNRSLEIEIRHIAEKLEQVRMATSISSVSREELRSPALQNGHKAIPTPSLRTRSASVDPSALSRPLDVSKATVPASPLTMLSIAQLDNQLRAMATQMDALVSERTTLIEAAARRQRITEGTNVDAFQDILRVEAECVRLQSEVDDLREQLQHARTYARTREKVLLREIAQLRVPSLGTSALDPDLLPVFSPRPLEADIAAEESMELVSPLIPTTFLAAPSHDVHAETDLVSFPFSPRYVSSPAPAAPSSPSHVARQSPGPQDIERVQGALDAARTHLAQKEEALAQLRVEMERLQLEVQVQTRRGGDGDGG